MNDDAPESGVESTMDRPVKSARGIKWSGDRAVSVSAALISLLAMGVSVRSCQVSEQQSNLAQIIFDREQRVVFRSEFADDPDRIVLTPVEATHVLQRGLILFPDQINVDSLEVRENGTVYGASALDLAVRDFLERYVRVEADHVAVGELQIPVLIFSHYTVSGDPMLDASTYTLTARYTASPSHVTHLTFVELVFMERDAERPPTGNFDVSNYRARLNSSFENVIRVLERQRDGGTR